MDSFSYADRVLIELLFKTLCDSPPSFATKGAYLFGQTEENQASVLDVGERLLREGLTKAVLIADTHARCGYPGIDLWRSELRSRDVSPEQILAVPVDPNEILHTNTESNAVAAFCRSKGFDTLTIVAAPFHQLRAFLSMVTAIVEQGYDLKLYNTVGGSLPWYDSVSHSQGTLVGSRESFIASELERIGRYHKKGDLLDAAKVLEYLRNRDR